MNYSITTAFISVLLLSAQSEEKKLGKAYAFAGALWHRHESVDAGKEMINQLAEEHNFEVVQEMDASKEGDLSEFTEFNLSQYDVIILNNADMLPTQFDDNQRAAFKSFIDNGGGVIGWHGGTATRFPDRWPWWVETQRAIWNEDRYSANNPTVVKTDHPSVSDMPDEFPMDETEWYYLNNDPNDLDETVSVVEDQNQGNSLAWASEFREGRVWLTVLGHANHLFIDREHFKNLVWGGIKWAAKWDEPVISTLSDTEPAGSKVGFHGTQFRISNEGSHTAELLDVSGRKVFGVSGHGAVNYDLSHLPMGIYFAKVQVGKQEFSKRVFIR